MKKLTQSIHSILASFAAFVAGSITSVVPAALADDVVFYPDGYFEISYVERADSIRDRELAAFGSGVLFLTTAEVVFVNGATPTVLKSGLSTPKHLLVKGDHYYFTEGSTLYEGIGLAAPTAVLTHTAQIDRLLYVDAQHKELAFVSPQGIHQRELFVFNFQSGIATDQGVYFSEQGLGDERRVPQRFAVGESNAVGSFVLYLKDISSGIEWNAYHPGGVGNSYSYLLSDGTKDEVFVGGPTFAFAKVDSNQANGFAMEQIGNPTDSILGHIPGYGVDGNSLVKDPHHDGYLIYRYDNGTLKLTRFTLTGYQDIADISSFQSENVLGQYDRFTLWVHRGQVFFRSKYTNQLTFGRLMPDDTVETVSYGAETVTSKSFMNIYSRRFDDDNSVEIGAVLYERYVDPLSGAGKAVLKITTRHLDQCPSTVIQYQAGACGCGVPETDTDSDGTLDCHESCDTDRLKTSPGACGCNVPDTDANNNGTADCVDVDLTLGKPSIAKVQRKVRVTLPTQASIRYRYTYKFLNRKGAVVKKATGQSNSGKQVSLSIPNGAARLVLSFIAKGPGCKDYQSPEYKKSL